MFFALLLICFLVTTVFGGFLLFVAATGKSNDDISKSIREVRPVGKLSFIWKMGEIGQKRLPPTILSTPPPPHQAFHEVVKIMWQLMSEEDRHQFEVANKCCGIDSSLESTIVNYK